MRRAREEWFPSSGVQYDYKVLESVISSEVWRTMRIPTKAPWTSSLELELVGQDNQDVDVDIPFVATLESLALTTSTAHKEENAKEKSTAEGDDLLLLAPKAQLVFGGRSRCRKSALVPFAVPVMADRPFAEMIKRHPLRLVRRRSSGSRCDDVVARSSYQPLQQ